MKKLIAFGLILVFVGAGIFWFLIDVPDFITVNEGLFHHNESPVLEVDNPEQVVVENDFEAFESDPSIVRFFYLQLNENEREIYRSIRDGLMALAPLIRLNTIDLDLATNIFERVLWDYPEIFWATGGANAQTINRFVGQNYINFMPEYSYLGDTVAKLQFAIDERVNAFLATISDNMSEFEMILAVYEYIILTTSYTLAAPDNQNIVSVFIHGESVCAGLSKAAQLLLNRLGIFATYVVGYAFVDGSVEPLAHAWNLVRVNEEYYHLDVTWGIPIFSEDSGVTAHVTILYDYFLINDDLLQATHQLRADVVIPAATSLRSNYFVVGGMFFETVDELELLAALQVSIEAERDFITFKFTSVELYEEAKSLLLDELVFAAAEPRALELGLEWIHFRFRTKANLNMMTVYWDWEQ